MERKNLLETRHSKVVKIYAGFIKNRFNNFCNEKENNKDIIIRHNMDITLFIMLKIYYDKAPFLKN